MTGIIWYYTSKNVGRLRLEDLVEEYKKINIEVKQSWINKTSASVVFDNGDIWDVVPANDRSRGRACNIALIESCTPLEIVNTIILPCLKNHPFRAYNYYFTQTDMDIEYEL